MPLFALSLSKGQAPRGRPLGIVDGDFAGAEVTFDWVGHACVSPLTLTLSRKGRGDENQSPHPLAQGRGTKPEPSPFRGRCARSHTHTLTLSLPGRGHWLPAQDFLDLLADVGR